MKKAVFSFGRLNPPTIGHQKLVDKVLSVARKERATPRVYLTKTQNKKKDPLTYDQKIAFAKKAFGNSVTKSDSRTLIEVAQELEKQGFTDIVMVAGDDRIDAFKKLLTTYNGKDYNFDSIEVVSAGKRDADAVDDKVKDKKKVKNVEQMSASAMRALAGANQMDDYEEEDDNGKVTKYLGFRSGLPKNLRSDAKTVMAAVRKGMGLNEMLEEQLQLTEDDLDFDDDELDKELFGVDTNDDNEFDELDPDDEDLAALDLLIPDEDLDDEDEEEEGEEDLQERKPLTLQQRLKMGRRMKRLAPRLARYRKIKAKRVAPPERLKYRARKAAINLLRKRVAGKKGASYKSLPTAQKIAIDKLIQQKMSAVGAIAKRMLPKIRKKELERVARARTSKKESFDAMFESFDINAQFEQKVAQDPDVKDLPGTQPKKYYKGLSDKEKEARAKQFAKGADKPDNDPASYKPAPGDDDAKTKPSKYTKKYKQMYGEAIGVRGDDDREADKNIIVQLRKSVDMRGNHPIVFDDGRKVKVKAGDAAKVLSMFNKIVKPTDKQAFQKHVAKSHTNLLQVLNAQYDIPPIRVSAISSQKMNEMFESEIAIDEAFDQIISDLQETRGVKGRARAINAFSVYHADPTRSPLSHAVPSSNYQLEKNLYTDKMNTLLRMGLADTKDLERYRRALKSGEKGLTNPVLRTAMIDILDKLVDVVSKDTTAYQRVRNAVLKGRTDTGPIEEQDAVKQARERIRREKESDKQKFDAIMDRARLQDARSKNRQESYDDLEEKSIEGLKKKSEKSGVPYSILKKVYDRGMAAWKTGHRPGTTPQQWAFARVNSFLTGGKTRTTADKDLWAKAREAKKSKRESVGLDEKRKPLEIGMKNALEPDEVVKGIGVSRYSEIMALSSKDKGQYHFFDNKDDAEAAQKKHGGRIEPVRRRMGGMFYILRGANILKAQNEENPCWDGYKQVGMKTGKDGKPVPNCVREEKIEEMPRWLLEPLSKITNKRGYKAAKKVLQDVLARKKKEAGRKGLQHTIEYYAQQIAKQFDGVDARVLADMVNEEYGAGEYGTNELVRKYKQDTPGENPDKEESYPRGMFKVEDLDESFVMDKAAGMGQTLFAQQLGIKADFGFHHHPTTDFQEDYLGWTLEEDTLEEAEYQGRKVKLRDPFRTPKGPKKFSVYVKNPKTGNVIKVNFGDPNMEIKRDDPESRKNFRARHNCDDKTDETTAGYWSCRMWEKGKTVSELD